MKAGILDLQTFFAEQMVVHGRGNTSFQIETDIQGDPVVHRVDGDHGESRYGSRGYTDGEIERAFDNSSNIMLVVMDVSTRTAHGRGTGSKSSGWAMIYGEWNWFAAAHELGHAFGLHHDFRDNEYIMSYGRADRSSAELSACAAEFLATHPYFNSEVPIENESPPTVELVSSEFPFGSVSTPVQLRVRDDDGLHQVILFVHPKNPFLGGTPEVKACRGMSGETETVVEFDFDGRLPSDNVGTVAEAHTTLANTVQHPIYVVAVDTAGNRTSTASLKSFTLEAGHSPQHIAALDRPDFYDVGDLAISPDGAFLAIGASGRVELLDVAKRETIATFRHSANTIPSVAFSPGGTLLAAGSREGAIKVWNVTSQAEVATLEGHSDPVASLDFSPDGSMLASGSLDRTVKLWNAATWTDGATLEGHTERIGKVAFVRDGKLASVSLTGTVRLWNVSTKSQISTIETGARGAVAVSRDGMLLASPTSWAIKLWDLATGAETGAVNDMRDYNRAYPVFSPDGTILAVTAFGLIEIWDVSKRELMASISGGPGGVRRLVFSPDGRMLIGNDARPNSREIKLWDVSEWASSGTSVCGRTPQVRDAIVGEVAGVSSCGNVTESHLAAIDNLDLNDREITTLREGDFDGMSGLLELHLMKNRLSGLPAGVFSGLSELTLIDLRSNRLVAIPEGVFSGLAALALLTMSDNHLTALPEGVFSGLSELTELYLRDNQLTTLPEGIFSGLAALTELHLYNNQLTALPESVFNGLSELRSLDLHGNELTVLPEGLFSGLSSLTSINLSRNSVDPLPLTVSLQKVADGQFKAMAPTGAPFEIVLPLSVTNGSISGGATTITIPAGSLESDTLSVTRTHGTSAAVTVWTGPLPGLPANHTGYRLVNNTGEYNPLGIFEDASQQIWSGTVTLGTWGNAFGNGNATGYGYNSSRKAGDISNATFIHRGTTYTIHEISIARIGNNLPYALGLTISPQMSSCDEQQIGMFGSNLLASRGTHTTDGRSHYRWIRSQGAWIPDWGSHVMHLGRRAWIRFTPTVPDAPFVAAINEGNQVVLHWITPCDGGIDITGHEYRAKADSGTFSSWTPIPNSAAGEVNATGYTVAGLNNPSEYTFEVRGVNTLGEGEISTEAMVRNPSVPLSDRTPQVRDGIVSALPVVSDFRNVTEAHLASITQLFLGFRNITALKPGDFSGLTALTHLNLPGNQLSRLPDGIFEGLTALTHLRLRSNSVTPLPLAVSLEQVAEGQFKAVAPTGAPFDIVLPVIVTNGSISGGANAVTIPKGSIESTPFTVIRTPGTSDAVTVDLGTLPGLPANHSGYTLVKIGTVSYDGDGDGLIEIGSVTQLNAVRWDLNGDGAVDNGANAAAYAHGFPNAVAGMGCPTTADDADDNDCIGYELAADLDFDTNGDGAVDAGDNYWNGGAGWAPIGSSGSGNEFMTTFEGNGHTVDNLYIDRETSSIGLFGVVGDGGQVRNVGVQYALVTGDGSNIVVGVLAGVNRGSIQGSYATGLAQTGESGSVGVLAGANTGIIASSYATGKSLCGRDGNAGGLVGLHGGGSDSRSSITASYATGEVSGSEESDLGGLAGQVAAIASGARGIITASYATGSVYGESESSNVGGLVGQTTALGNDCKAIITASYATGEVSGVGSNVGGLVGHNLSGGPGSGGIITASYATGEVSGSDSGNVGGLVGQDSTNLNSSNTINHSYWNTETSGQATSDGGTGKSTRELVAPTGYTGIYLNWNLDLDGDTTNDDPWDFGTPLEYPMLRVDFDGDGDVDAQDIDPQRRVTSPPTVSTDFNGDGRTDFGDFFLFADAYGGSDAKFDLDGNGIVDLADFFKFVGAFRS
ncbi:MAG: leucine-rich repeat domain-containing protein [Gemmatimonadota bacterium]|nr:leucine-rich repeat domain-containing protein [Gemmatimonadota bacterium]